jgi:hypothetical protein
MLSLALECEVSRLYAFVPEFESGELENLDYYDAMYYSSLSNGSFSQPEVANAMSQYSSLTERSILNG